MTGTTWIKITGWSALAIFCAAVGFVWLGNAKPRVIVYQLRRLAETLHIKLPPPAPLTLAEQAAARSQAIAWKAASLAEFPALRVTPHPVPAAENGFLMLHALASLTISDEFAEILRNPGTCEVDAARRCLAEHADIVGHAEEIGRLRTRSSMGMPESYRGFINARPVKTCSDILMLKACLAAKAGDGEEALRCVRSAGNLAEHLHDVEAPTLLAETVVILIDRARQQIMLDTLLPALGKSEDLNGWRAELTRISYTPVEFAKVLRGEWDAAADFLLAPVLAEGVQRGEYPNGEVIARSHSSWCNDAVVSLGTVPLADLKATLVLPPTPGLSANDRKLLSTLHVGMDSWASGYIRSAVMNARCRAAMELLILEQSGHELCAEDARAVSRNPLTGAPFDFDPILRTVSIPSSTDDDTEDPLKLPW